MGRAWSNMFRGQYIGRDIGSLGSEGEAAREAAAVVFGFLHLGG